MVELCWVCGWAPEHKDTCMYSDCPMVGLGKMHDSKHEDPRTIEEYNEAYDRIMGNEAHRPGTTRMNQADLFAFHEKFCADALALTKKKNNDYAGSSGTQPFANFELAEEMGICSTEQGFLVRLTDKMQRVATFVHDGVLQVEDESVRDTLIDIVNYTVLLAAYIEDKKGAQTDG